MDLSNRPAVRQLLTHDHPWTDSDGVPTECPCCPFATLAGGQGDISNDPSEAHYDCALLHQRVWGESPQCVLAEWRTRALKELAEAD